MRVREVQDDRERPRLEGGPRGRVGPDRKAQVLDGRDAVLAALPVEEPRENAAAGDFESSSCQRRADLSSLFS